jgi:hypothetical protein
MDSGFASCARAPERRREFAPYFSVFSKFESYRAVHKGLDCFGAARLAMTSRSRHCEPKAKQSSVRGQRIGFMESRD